MRYISTRGGGRAVSAAQAIVSGLAPDGGLFVPEAIPVFSREEILALDGLSYPRLAARVLAKWLDDFSEDELFSMCGKAYARFDCAQVAPVRDLPNGVHALELWHGPTLAFKDVALTLLPHLLRGAAIKTGEAREICILVATSGDTGKAALEGFRDVPGTRVVVFYPEGGVSEAQRLQMATQEGGNTFVVAVKGNFDDAQTGVKRLFSDCALADRLARDNITLSSANSINLGRLAPQIAYYFAAYLDLVRRGALTFGAEANVCVPTGNFGNILSACYARAMGLPIGRLVCASNENNVLADFIQIGVYDRRRAFRLTSSPSMDILVSSNLERMLSFLTDGDGARVSEWMRRLGTEGVYRMEGAPLDRLRGFMTGGWASEADVSREIRRVFDENGYLIDPHTAVAFSVYGRYRLDSGDTRPVIVASTASPFKFGRAMARALGLPDAADDFACCADIARHAGLAVPEAIASLPRKPILHTRVCAANAMENALMEVFHS